jgi:hypothetical protein
MKTMLLSLFLVVILAGCGGAGASNPMFIRWMDDEGDFGLSLLHATTEAPFEVQWLLADGTICTSVGVYSGDQAAGTLVTTGSSPIASGCDAFDIDWDLTLAGGKLTAVTPSNNTLTFSVFPDSN